MIGGSILINYRNTPDWDEACGAYLLKRLLAADDPAQSVAFIRAAAALGDDDLLSGDRSTGHRIVSSTGRDRRRSGRPLLDCLFDARLQAQAEPPLEHVLKKCSFDERRISATVRSIV